MISNSSSRSLGRKLKLIQLCAFPGAVRCGQDSTKQTYISAGYETKGNALPNRPSDLSAKP